MIRKPENYDNVMVVDKLPVGGYIMRIVRVDYDAEKNYVKLGLDIDEGPFKGYWDKKKYQSGMWNTDACTYLTFNENENSLKVTKANITSIERSNDGYVWDWNEKSLLHKRVGGVFGLKEYEGLDGSVKTRPTLRSLRSVSSIVNGEFTVPDVKRLEPKTDDRAVSSFIKNMREIVGTDFKSNVTFEVDDDDLPF